jgi:CrcB protein
MNDWPIWIAISLGGAAGALLRGLIFHAIERVSPADGDHLWAGYGSARGTLIVNVVGSLLVGFLVGGQWERLAISSDPLQIFWLTGICGALTTFSALCADVIALAQAGQNIRGAGVLMANIVLGLSALSLGLAFAN